jgi:hypothetical protein
VLYPSEEENEKYQKFLIEKRTLGKGELKPRDFTRLTQEVRIIGG